MTDMMQKLGIEHRNMARLLNILEQQLAIFERGDRPDYDIIQAIATYFTGFPDSCHHPKEDMILSRMRIRDAKAAERVGDLESEHQEISVLAKRFNEMVENILNEGEISREEFSAAIRDFLDCQRRHMQGEREGFFLIAEATLEPSDWEELDSAVNDEDDPVFGGELSLEFEILREEIMRWQEEDEKAALMGQR
ncbi:MAG: hemerythrin domain-containing protein [Kiloniellales bacterium]